MIYDFQINIFINNIKVFYTKYNMFRCGQVDAIFGASVMIHSVQFFKNQPSLTTFIFITDFSDPLMLRPLEPDINFTPN